MTNTETVEALLADLTAGNQAQLLPILADALSDAGFEKQEQALRWALGNDKRPLLKEEITDSTETGLQANLASVYWRPDNWVRRDHTYSILPYRFVIEMTHKYTGEIGTRLLDGRYFDSVEEAWRSFLVCAESHLRLLISEVNS